MIILISILAIVSAISLLLVQKIINFNRQFAKTARKKQQEKNGNILHIISVIMFISGIVGLSIGFFCPKSTVMSDTAKETLFASHGFAVAEKIAANYKNEKILLLLSGNESSKRVDRLKNAISVKLGSGVEIDVIQITPESAKNYDPDDMPEFHVMIKAKDFDQALLQEKDASIVIIACELPKDAGRMKLWSENPRKKVFLLNSPCPLDDAIAKGYIAGYTILDKNAQLDNISVPNDYAKAFASRFKIIARI